MRYTKEEIDLGFDVVDCEYVFNYDYTPEEPMVKYYPDGSGYPGSPEYIDVYDVVIAGVFGENGKIQLTQELKDILLKKFDDFREDVEDRIRMHIYAINEEYDED
jgi:hypothetical protein